MTHMSFSRARNLPKHVSRRILLGLSLAIITATTVACDVDSDDGDRIVLRAWGVPSSTGSDVHNLSTLEMLEAFQRRFPGIQPVTSTGLVLVGSSTMQHTVR